jgi:hypothetical protein
MSMPLNLSATRIPRVADAAVERARLTVVPRRTRQAPRMPFVVLVSVLLVGGVAGLLFFNTSMQQASFTASDLESRATALHAKEQSLKMRLDTLRDPQRIAVRAQHLGMVPDGSPAFLRLHDGRTLGRAQAAQAGDSVRLTALPTRKPKSLRPTPVIADPPASGTAGKQAAKSGPGHDDAPPTGHRDGGGR